MFAKIESWLTLGNRYVSATMVYLGIALLLAGSTLLDSPNVLATNDLGCSYTVMVDQEGVMVPVTYDGCPEGQHCCGGECISDSEICCEDGTHGDEDMCICCETCDEFGFWTTIECDDDEGA